MILTYICVEAPCMCTEERAHRQIKSNFAATSRQRKKCLNYSFILSRHGYKSHYHRAHATRHRTFTLQNHGDRYSSDAFNETVKRLDQPRTPKNYLPGRKSMLEYDGQEGNKVGGDALSRPPRRLGRRRGCRQERRHQACRRRAYRRACHHHHQLRRTSS
jgi:hypothetical protein